MSHKLIYAFIVALFLFASRSFAADPQKPFVRDSVQVAKYKSMVKTAGKFAAVAIIADVVGLVTYKDHPATGRAFFIGSAALYALAAVNYISASNMIIDMAIKPDGATLCLAYNFPVRKK